MVREAYASPSIHLHAAVDDQWQQLCDGAAKALAIAHRQAGSDNAGNFRRARGTPSGGC